MATNEANADLIEIVTRALEDDAGLEDEAALLVQAAMEGDAALADLSGFTPPTTIRADLTGSDTVEPAGAFLDAITVTGFRGIGPVATLPLTTGPGLTIVAGRNGSGKSSFCEALEVALTGRSDRWERKKSVQWQSAWRNLHSTSTEIVVTLAEEGVGTTSVRSEWGTDAGFSDVRVSVQRSGEKREDGISGLGWDQALDSNRPILTYDELGNVLTSTPSEFHDELSMVLGLEAISAAIARLDARVKDLGQPKRRLGAAKKEVLEALSASDDERASAAKKLVRARSLDLLAIRALASGTGETTGTVLGDLRRLAEVTVPDIDAVTAVIDRLRIAANRRDHARGPADTALQRRITLITAALELHADHGDMPCPVCGKGSLDADTTGRLRTEVDEDRTAFDALNAANAEVMSAVTAARRLIMPALPPIATALEGGVGERHDAAAAALADWGARANGSDDPRVIADDLENAVVSISESVAALTEAARSAITEREDAWAPVATRLGAFAEAAETADAVAVELDQHDRAAKWLKTHDRDLKNARLQPIAEEAMQIWSLLRQESNVEIAGLSLDGTSTQRRVTITSRVDGEEAPGITVLSQGELHALALAIFLPRATMAESPFRFVVLDDPVQAMDPSKVDGLLAVLARIAERRQVIVFSHDDRLANAARHGGVDATILEVSREVGSRVTVSRAIDPAERYVRDARAMTKDENLPVDVLRRLLPGVLRLAVEAAARDRWFGDALKRGMTRDEVEIRWNAATTTRARVSLAVSGTTDGMGDWHTRRPLRKDAMAVVTAGMHDGLAGDPFHAFGAARQLVSDIRERAT